MIDEAGASAPITKEGGRKMSAQEEMRAARVEAMKAVSSIKWLSTEKRMAIMGFATAMLLMDEQERKETKTA